MGIGSTHPDYDNQLERWRKNRDALAGQDAIHRGGRKYLPDDAEGSSALEAVQRYNRYRHDHLDAGNDLHPRWAVGCGVFKAGVELPGPWSR